MVRAEGFEPSTHALKAAQAALDASLSCYGVWYSSGAGLQVLRGMVSGLAPFLSFDTLTGDPRFQRTKALPRLLR
jgi:hypothetical protein